MKGKGERRRNERRNRRNDGERINERRNGGNEKRSKIINNLTNVQY